MRMANSVLIWIKSCKIQQFAITLFIRNRMPPVRRARIPRQTLERRHLYPPLPRPDEDDGFLANAVLPGGSFRPLTTLCRVPEPGAPILAAELPACGHCRPVVRCADTCHGVRGCAMCCLENCECKHARRILETVPDPKQMLTCAICLGRTHEPYAVVNADTGVPEPTTYCFDCIVTVTDTLTRSPTTRAKIESFPVPRFDRSAICALLATAPTEPPAT